MIFADLLAGAPVFVDANTLVYHFALDPRHGTACTQLLERVARQELVAFTSTHVLSDATHRCMTLEAIARDGHHVTLIVQVASNSALFVSSIVSVWMPFVLSFRPENV
jgi:predicted nucleic acid-binding protein